MCSPDYDPQCITPESPRRRMSNKIPRCSSHARVQQFHALLTGSLSTGGGVGQSSFAEIILIGARGPHASWTECLATRRCWRMRGLPRECPSTAHSRHACACVCCPPAPVRRRGATSWLLALPGHHHKAVQVVSLRPKRTQKPAKPQETKMKDGITA